MSEDLSKLINYLETNVGVPDNILKDLEEIVNSSKILRGEQEIIKNLSDMLIAVESSIVIVIPKIIPKVLQLLSQQAYQKKSARFLLISSIDSEIYGNIIQKMEALGNVQFRYIIDPFRIYSCSRDADEFILGISGEQPDDSIGILSDKANIYSEIGPYIIQRSQHNNAIRVKEEEVKRDMGDLIEYITKLPNIYKRASLSDIGERKGVSSQELINLVEDLIINGKINATINGDELVFKETGAKSSSQPISTAKSIATPNVEPKPEREVLPDTFEASVYKKMKDTGSIDLAMIADKYGISTDKVIMVMYRMMTEFDGDIEGDKFRPLVDVKLSSIEKLTQKLEEN